MIFNRCEAEVDNHISTDDNFDYTQSGNVIFFLPSYAYRGEGQEFQRENNAHPLISMHECKNILKITKTVLFNSLNARTEHDVQFKNYVIISQ